EAAVAAEEALIEAEAGTGERCRIGGGSMVDVFSDETHAAIAKDELRAAGMEAVKALPLGLIAGIAGNVHRPLSGAVEGEDVRAVGGAVGREPASVPDAVPVAATAGLLGRVRVAEGDLAHHDGVRQSVGDLRKTDGDGFVVKH